jgi:hypothetical protein
MAELALVQPSFQHGDPGALHMAAERWKAPVRLTVLGEEGFGPHAGQLGLVTLVHLAIPRLVRSVLRTVLVLLVVRLLCCPPEFVVVPV